MGHYLAAFLYMLPNSATNMVEIRRQYFLQENIPISNSLDSYLVFQTFKKIKRIKPISYPEITVDPPNIKASLVSTVIIGNSLWRNPKYHISHVQTNTNTSYIEVIYLISLPNILQPPS